MAFFSPAVARLTYCVLLLLSASRPLLAHREYVHQYLAVEAYKLLLHRYPGLASSEFASHIGSQSGNCDGFQFTAGTITAGAYREDCEDPVYHYGDVVGPLDDAYFSASHFWDADAGDRSTIEICDLSCGKYQNSYQKSLRYVLPGIYGRWTAKLTWPAGVASFYLQSGGTGSIFHNGLIGFEYDSLARFYRDGRCTITGFIDITGKWQTASTVPDQLPLKIIAPKNVRDRIAWEVIGRITHLLGDMGVPAHAHNDIHPPFWWNNDPADIFEEEMSRLYSSWDYEDAAAQGHLLDVRQASPGGAAENAMRYLLYTTNQVADRFPSNDGDGDSGYEREWGGDDYSVLDIIEEIGADPSAGNDFHPEAGDYAFVFSIRSIAGLFQWFAVETGMLARITVEADFAGAAVLVDGKPRATPEIFTSPVGTRFTLEARDQQVADPSGNGSWTMRFNSWDRFIPGVGESRLTERQLVEFALDGARYQARFDREVTILIAEPRHLDGGSGGVYSVNGTDAGSSWTGTVNTVTVQSLIIGMTPPAGSVFLCWSDGVRDNPREIRPAGNMTLRAFCKQRLLTTSPPADRRANQRWIAATANAEAGAVTSVIAYESSGNIFFTESQDGTQWSDEELVSDGAGNARDPSIDYFVHPSEGESGSFIVWEEAINGGTGYRILVRIKQRYGGGWTGIRVVHADSSGGALRAAPVISADLVAWKGPGGIIISSLSGPGPFIVPGTDAGSDSPILDFYSYGEGKFALAWIQSGNGILFRRGSWPGPSWSNSRIVASAIPGETVRNADLALSATGSGCVAWTADPAGGWNIRYRLFDPSDAMQAVTAMLQCPISGAIAPVPRLAHHRQDPGAVKEIALHAWIPGSGAILSLLFRAGLRIGPTATPVSGADPDIPRSALASPRGTPILFTGNRNGSYWALAASGVQLSPAVPSAPVLLSPPSGAQGVGASVQLTWNCSADAESYAVQVSRNPSFSPLVAEQGAITGRSFGISNLAPGTLYHWRVRGYNSLGAGSYSQASSFSTSPLPPAPVLSGTIVTVGSARHPRLSWSAPAGFTSYRLYRYICAASDDCAAAAARPAMIYEGTSTGYTDGNTIVSAKTATSRAYYYVSGRSNGFTTSPSNTVSFGTQGTVVLEERPDDPPVPEASGLGENYPNPFNPSTTITYRLSTPALVSLSVYNLLGQRVANLLDGPREAGFHEMAWDAAGVPAGVYIVAMDVTEVLSGWVVRDRRKVVLLK